MNSVANLTLIKISDLKLIFLSHTYKNQVMKKGLDVVIMSSEADDTGRNKF